MHERLARIIAWLRASYPAGVPSQDYLPLFALMRRRLSEEEINELGLRMQSAGLLPADPADVGVEMWKVTQDLPTPTEIDRVVQYLRERGFDVDAALGDA